MQIKIKKIRSLFLWRMILSLIAQSILIASSIFVVEKYMTNYAISEMSDSLLINDQYTTDQITSYLKLHETYALQLELHNIGNMKKLDAIRFENVNSPAIADARENEKFVYKKNGNYIIRHANNNFEGVTTLLFEEKPCGYIITNKHYSTPIAPSTPNELVTSLLTACLAFLLNFIFLFSSLKNRILRNASYAIEMMKAESSNEANKSVDIYEFRYLIDKILHAKKENEKLLMQKAFAETAASVVHDIRSPLAVMELTLNKFRSSLKEDAVLELHNSVENIKSIANNLLSRHRDQPLIKLSDQYRPPLNGESADSIIHIHSFITNIILEKQIEWTSSQVRFVTDFNDDSRDSLIRTSPTHLKRVLSNLLNNSYDATKGNGEIKVSVKSNTCNVIIQIEDSGVGIPEELQHAVKFGFSTKHHGKGLGLSGAFSFMSQLNGSLEIQSLHKIGTIVTLTIPKEAKPSWMPLTILLKNHDNVICASNNIGMLTNIQKIFMKQPVYIKLHYSLSDCLTSISTTEPNQEIHLFIDSTALIQDSIELANVVRLRKIKFYILSATSYSITVQEMVKKYNAELIPTSIIEFVPIETT